MFFDFNAMLTDRINEVADFTPEQAEALEFGATTVIGILSNATNLIDQTPEGEAAITALFDAANPFIESLRVATLAAQVEDVQVEDEPLAEWESLAEWEKELLGITDEEPVEEDDEAARVSAIDDIVEGLFAAMIGAEGAAIVRAQVEADRLANVEEEVEVEEDTTPEDEFDKFLRDLLASA